MTIKKVLESSQSESEPFGSNLPFSVTANGTIPTGGLLVQSRIIGESEWRTEWTLTNTDKTTPPGAGTRALEFRVQVAGGGSGVEAWIIDAIPQSYPR